MDFNMGVLYALESVRQPVLDRLLGAVTYLGSEWAFIAIAVAVYWCVSKKHGYYLLAAGVISTAVSQFMKIMCRVERPFVRDPDFTIVESARAGATGYSFPSGHSQSAAAVIGGVARFTERRAVRIVCIVLAALTAFSRMYLGVHYPTDVLGGLAIGLVVMFALYPVFEKSDERPAVVPVVFGVTAVAALAAAAYVEHRVWPQDIDAENLAEAIKNLYLLGGSAAALAVSAPIERRCIRFDVQAPLWAQALKLVLGVALIFGVRAVCKPVVAAVFGALGVGTAVRYFVMVVFVVLVWPLTFPWFARGCRRRKAVEAKGGDAEA